MEYFSLYDKRVKIRRIYYDCEKNVNELKPCFYHDLSIKKGTTMSKNVVWLLKAKLSTKVQNNGCKQFKVIIGTTMI